MEAFARWVWHRWKHRFATVYITTGIVIALVVVTWPAVTIGSLYFALTGAETLVLFAVVTAVVIVNLGFALMVSGRSLWRQVGAWVAGEGDAGALRDSALHEPPRIAFRATLITAPVNAIGGGAAVTFLADASWVAFVFLAATIVFASQVGAVICAVSFDLLLRPLREELALSSPSVIGRSRWGVGLRLLLSAAAIAWYAGMATPAVVLQFDSMVGRFAAALVASIVFMLIFAVAIFWELTVRPVLRPVDDLMDGTRRVAAGDYTRRLLVTSDDELGRLVASFNEMQDGLLERERLHAAFGSYVDPGLAERLLAQGDDDVFTGEEADATMFFVDIRDFTAYSERATAREAVARLNALFGIVVPVLHGHQGHANKYSGDGVLAVFGVPERLEDHADRAVRAAIDIQRQVRAKFGEQLRIGIGINTGHVIAGTVGGGGRLEFALIGDAVNVAARIEDLTKQTGDAILLTQATLDALCRPVEGLLSRGAHQVRGKAEPITVHAVDPWAEARSGSA